VPVGCSLVVGLDSSGKTSLVWALSGQEEPATPQPAAEVVDVELVDVHCAPPPTRNATAVEVVLRGRHVRLVDTSGSQRRRTEWAKLALQADGLMFTVDSADSIRFSLARHELSKLMAALRSRSMPLLVLATKRDLRSAAPAAAVQAALQVGQLAESRADVAFTGVSALEPRGVTEAVVTHLLAHISAPGTGTRLQQRSFYALSC